MHVLEYPPRLILPIVETLAPQLERLLGMPPIRDGELPRDIPDSVVYLFTENGRHQAVFQSLLPQLSLRLFQ
jgi:hypothetical protein